MLVPAFCERSCIPLLLTAWTVRFRFIGGDVGGIGAPFSLVHVPSPIIAHDVCVSGHVVEASLLAVPLGSVADML